MNTYYNLVDNGLIEYFFGNASSGNDITGNKNILRRKKVYWISQITGWSIFGAANVFINSSLEGFTLNTILVWFIVCLAGIFWTLIYFSVHYFENYKKAEIESYIWEAAVKDFELKTLKSQLNPHFMFNALNSIRALIEEDPKSAQTAVTKLSNILRYSLKMERIETVPLEDEMKAVSDYLSLEKIRFEERLKFEMDISPNSLSVEIPPMMIQTLVENGIKHGISKRTDGGEISICATVNDSDLHIKIKNNGRIEDEMLKQSKGFGISNTKHRLNLLYGEKASFIIKNDSENMVLAEITIPINFNSPAGFRD
ncbi:MAG: histidine kinase [Ignavibacteriaceae bacterium]